MVEFDHASYYIDYCKQDLHEPIEGSTTKPKDMSDGNWLRMHKKAIADWLHQTMGG